MTTLGELVEVEWVDTTNIADWLESEELATWAADGGWVCRNVGWMSYIDPECVVVSSRRAKTGAWGLSERIPKASILKMGPPE